MAVFGCPNASMCTSYDTVDAKGQAWRSVYLLPFNKKSNFDFQNLVRRCYNHFQISKKEFSKFSLQVLQQLPDIQKGIFEIQLAG